MNKESIFSESFSTGNRTYFFDVKEAINNKLYLSVTESKKVGDDFEQYKILIFEENIEKFSKYFSSAISNLFEKSTRSNGLSHMDKQRLKYANAYKPWSQEDDNKLELLYCEGHSVKEISQQFKRNA